MTTPEQQSRQRILVVDDTKLNAAILARILDDDYLVDLASSGLEALDKVARNLPDLILLDIFMPEIDGLETCRRLKSNPLWREIPVIFVTAALDAETEALAFSLGAVDFIHKPISPSIVSARVQTHLALRRHARALEVANADLEGKIKARSQELARVMEQLLHTERLAAMGSMVAGFSHEINTPITNLRTVAEGLHERVQQVRRGLAGNTLRRSEIETLLDENERGTTLIENNVKRAVDLVESFKLVAVDQTSMRRRRFNLHDLINDTLRAISPAYKRLPVSLTRDIPDDLALDTFPGALEQIVTNLVINAVKHGRSSEAPERVLNICLSAARVNVDDSPWCCLTIADDGVGMDSAVAARAFDRFFTTKLAEGGSGLGLFLVQSLCTETLGGDVRLVSSPGAGATFEIRFPVRAP